MTEGMWGVWNVRKLKRQNVESLILLTAGFILFLVLVTAYALTVEAPDKKIQVARGNNVTLHCNFRTEATIGSGDIVVWKKINSPVNQVA